MDSIKMTMPITVKAKLTEKLRERLVGDLTKNIEQLDLELKQIGIERQRELNEHPEHGDQIVRFFGAETQKRQQQREEALNRKEYLEKLTEGAEIVQGTLQHQVELKIGDNFRELMNMEILVEDDKIIAIRG
jgi:hypothetical protein